MRKVTEKIIDQAKLPEGTRLNAEGWKASYQAVARERTALAAAMFGLVSSLAEAVRDDPDMTERLAELHLQSLAYGARAGLGYQIPEAERKAIETLREALSKEAVLTAASMSGASRH